MMLKHFLICRFQIWQSARLICIVILGLSEFNLVLFQCDQGVNKLQYIWCFHVKLIAVVWYYFQFAFVSFAGLSFNLYMEKDEICKTIGIYLDAIYIFSFCRISFFNLYGLKNEIFRLNDMVVVRTKSYLLLILSCYMRVHWNLYHPLKKNSEKSEY